MFPPSKHQNDTPSTAETQERLNQALEPYVNEWTNSLTEGEIDLVARLPESECAAMFAIWLADGVSLYRMLWKGEWQKRFVAEANIREVINDLKKLEDELEKVKEELRGLKHAAKEAARGEQDLKKEDGFLKRAVGGMKWEHDSGNDIGADSTIG